MQQSLHSSTIIALYKLIFGSLLKNPDNQVDFSFDHFFLRALQAYNIWISFGAQNVLKMYMLDLVNACVRSCGEAQYPLQVFFSFQFFMPWCTYFTNLYSRCFQYFTLLRQFCRGIGGGKFEILYKEFLPLLSDLFTGVPLFIVVNIRVGGGRGGRRG